MWDAVKRGVVWLLTFLSSFGVVVLSLLVVLFGLFVVGYYVFFGEFPPLGEWWGMVLSGRMPV